MDFYDVIDKRRTVRDFTDEDIPYNTIERIIEAAFKAPTNDHLRDWEYIIINDKVSRAAQEIVDLIKAKLKKR